MKPQKTHTITTLKERTIEDGDCWEWQGYCANGTPSVCHQGKMISVRRLFTQLLGNTVREGYYVPKCGNGLCVNPEHITYNDPKLHMKKAARKALKSPTRRLKIQIHKRATNAKLTQEKCVKPLKWKPMKQLRDWKLICSTAWAVGRVWSPCASPRIPELEQQSSL